MAAQVADPVREFAHTHEHLNKLALAAGQLIRSTPGAEPTEDTRRRLRADLASLREALLHHFAVEEEGLFPFIRSKLPWKIDHVDRLTLAHDTICGTVLRLAHAADANQVIERQTVLAGLYQRFETAYALHSREEAALLADLGHTLDASLRAELADLLRGL
ncbi:MAG: hemerythrin domain-containing protein [Polyangiaceae bacterium]|jgi:iron-sulfur cluster repair protein YtfE (RIC family)